MRKGLWITGILLLSSVAALGEMKIGFINSEEVFREYKGTKDAQEEFDKIAADLQQKAEDMKKEIEEMSARLEKQSLLLSDERRKEMEEKIKAKIVEYKQFIGENFGQDGKVFSKNAEMTKPIVQRINKIIERIAKNEKYDYIFDARQGGLVYAKKSYDLTARIIRILNKE